MQDRIPLKARIQEEEIPEKETKKEWSQRQEDSMTLEDNNAV